MLLICCFFSILHGLTAAKHESQHESTIPAAVMDRLASARTHAEFIRHLNIVRPTAAARGGINGEGSVRTAQIQATDIDLSNVRAEYAHLPGDGIEVIENPEQTKDSCKLFTHCVPIPVRTRPGVVYFPQCIDMPQCTGGCCLNANTCRATKQKKVKVQVMEYTHVGNNQFSGPEVTYVVMEKHEECQCASCRVPRNAMEQCGENQRWENCQCVCTNSDQAAQCIGENKVWSSQKCKCQCASNTCPADKFLDPSSCRCRSISEVGNSGGGRVSYNRDSPRVVETVITVEE